MHGALQYDMGLDEYKSKLEDSSNDSHSERRMRDKGDVKEAIDDSDAIIKEYESRSGSYSCLCVCQTCGEEFWKGVSRIERGDGKYCSNECSVEGRKGMVMKDIDIEDTVALSYIGGLIYGDGSIRHIEKTGNYDVVFSNTSEVLIEQFTNEVESLGCSVNCTILKDDNDNHKDVVNAKTSSKMLYDFIEENFESVGGVKNYCTSDEEMKSFIRGFYEAEGSYEEYRIRISQADKDILRLLKSFIHEVCNIDSVIRSYGDNGEYFNLVIQSQENMSEFVNTISPSVKVSCNG